MHMRRTVLAGFVFALGLLLAPAALAADPFKVDPVHSTVIFRVKHFGVGYIYGRFDQVSGTFAFDDNNPADSSLAMEVKTDSVDTNNPGRDKHLKGPDFFNVKEFPTISFKSKEVKKIDDQNYEVTGDLTLLSTTNPVTIKVERVGTAKGQRGGLRSGIEATFTIKRSDFGMKFMVGPVSDEVRVTVATEGVQQ
jgi:polyisoprenoid-binding protein YceI